MSPPGKRNGPTRSEPASKAALDDDTSRVTMDSEFPATAATNPAPRRRHSSQFCRWSHFDKNRRRIAQRELDRLLAEMYPQPARVPCDFGLTQDELCREARRLYAAGWTVEEIRATLELGPVSAP